MSRELDVQREVARIALASAGDCGFALAGSGAIREHGIIDRPTQDVDLFTTTAHVEQVERAAERAAAELRSAGYHVEEVTKSPSFTRLQVRSGDAHSLEVDFAIDWRKSDPVMLNVGPVLSLEDAIANKVSALYSRGEPRDYLDVDAIRGTGRFTDEELLGAAAERDPGFETGMFADQLDASRHITPRDVRMYGVDDDQLELIKERMGQWARQIRTPR
ncbi:nucleotidyl transferase AbiEii/AbiGii toxin family protein [Sinomonas sp. JGH33]|uniref:Nucleotidyl transferase AbiEii/AbiGii toxin family protein n=1 Tax=Sinomonas terricola TaxID=3110330 RepID=A0ABU5T6R0_9MICC|nr:nucleotidyl transferase AbiEii/AbiGii toxin family protein [Sinomonas sp. JGH33]MEA5454821.1 nucleotidyl transferase AbiEii/AbiGii toxin family protein [Sinomonas sp. JGH33]